MPSPQEMIRIALLFGEVTTEMAEGGERFSVTIRHIPQPRPTPPPVAAGYDDWPSLIRAAIDAVGGWEIVRDIFAAAPAKSDVHDEVKRAVGVIKCDCGTGLPQARSYPEVQPYVCKTCVARSYTHSHDGNACIWVPTERTPDNATTIGG